MIIKLNPIVNLVQLEHILIVNQVLKNLVLKENQLKSFVEKRNLHSKERKVLILKSTNSFSDLIEVRKVWNYSNYL